MEATNATNPNPAQELMDETMHHDGNIDLAGIFTVCTHRLENEFKHLMSQNHPNALRANLLRLRLSRWGKARNIHEGLGLDNPNFDIEDFQDAEKALRSLLRLLDTKLPKMNEEKELLDRETRLMMTTIDAIVAQRTALLRPPRSPIPRPNEHGGCLDWPTEQYEKAACCLSDLEHIFGVGQLRELSLEEKEKLVAAPGRAIVVLTEAAMRIDCWTADHADSARPSSYELPSNPMLDVYLGETTIQEVTAPPA